MDGGEERERERERGETRPARARARSRPAVMCEEVRRHFRRRCFICRENKEGPNWNWQESDF